MNDPNLSASDIPGLDEGDEREFAAISPNEVPLQLYHSTPDNERFILNLIYQAKTSGRNAGRRSLVEQARQNGVVIHETKVRSIIEKLRSEGLIEVSTGRGGIALTERGYHLCCGNTEKGKSGEMGVTGR